MLPLSYLQNNGIIRRLRTGEKTVVIRRKTGYTVGKTALGGTNHAAKDRLPRHGGGKCHPFCAQQAGRGAGRKVADPPCAGGRAARIVFPRDGRDAVSGNRGARALLRLCAGEQSPSRLGHQPHHLSRHARHAGLRCHFIHGLRPAASGQAVRRARRHGVERAARPHRRRRPRRKARQSLHFPVGFFLIRL